MSSVVKPLLSIPTYLLKKLLFSSLLMLVLANSNLLYSALFIKILGEAKATHPGTALGCAPSGVP